MPAGCSNTQIKHVGFGAPVRSAGRVNHRQTMPVDGVAFRRVVATYGEVERAQAERRSARLTRHVHCLDAAPQALTMNATLDQVR